MRKVASLLANDHCLSQRQWHLTGVRTKQSYLLCKVNGIYASLAEVGNRIDPKRGGLEIF